MNNSIAFVLCIFCSVIIFSIMGLNYFALYQLLPIILFYIFQITVFNKVQVFFVKVCYVLSMVIMLLFPLSAIISWYFDVNQIASRSSTSGLLFVWLPIYSVLPGIFVCLIGWILISKFQK